MEFDISRLPSYKLGEAFAAYGSVLIPTGSTEIIGDHAPVGTDNIVARHVIPLISERAEILHAPLIPYGDTLELPPGAGTIHIPEQVLQDFYYAVASSLFRYPEARCVYFINFHSLNNRAVDSTCRILRSEGKRAYLIDWWKTVGQHCGDLLSDKKYGRGHGGEMISSVLMALDPELVDTRKDNPPPREGLDFYNRYIMNSGSPFSAYGNFSDYCEGSAWGSLDGAGAGKGRVMIDRAVTAIAGFIRESREALGIGHQ